MRPKRPGRIKVEADADAEDPIIAAWLSFIDEDIKTYPERLAALTEDELNAFEALVETVEVDDCYLLPDDATF